MQSIEAQDLHFNHILNYNAHIYALWLLLCIRAFAFSRVPLLLFITSSPQSKRSVRSCGGTLCVPSPLIPHSLL